MKILYLFSFIGLIFILPSLIFAVHTKSDSVAVDIPGNNFSPGWRRVGRLRIYKGHDLFNYIDGGAELFNEFGFEELNVQLYGNGTEEITLEIYRMKSTVAALGIYLIKKGEETPYPEILTRNSATPFQCIAVKNRYFIVVTNTSGSEDIKRVVISLINRIILTIPEGKKVDLLRRLPQKGRVKGTEIIIAGQYSTESVYTFGEGNILRLGGGVFGVAADYIDSQSHRTTLINIQYHDENSARTIFTNLGKNLDPYLKIINKSENRIVFKDYNDQYGEILRDVSVIRVRLHLLKNPCK